MSLRTGVSPFQFFLITINTSFGAGILIMPRSVAEVAKEDMWLSVIFGGSVFMFAFWAAVKLSQYFPQYTCIEYHRVLLGPTLGQVLNIALLSLLVVLTAFSLRVFAMALKAMLLDAAPPQIIVAVILLLAVYATQYGLAPFMRVQQFIFMSNNFLLIPVIILGLLAININYYQPVFAKGVTPVMKGVIPCWYAYTGPELAVGLIYPFIFRQKYAVKWGAAGIAVLIVIYTLLTMIVQGILTSKETSYLLLPTVSAYREVEIPDTFIERLDGYLMVLWIPLYFTSLINLFYFSSFGTAQMLKLENIRPVTLLLVPLIYYLVSIPPNTQTLIAINQYTTIAAMLWGLGIVPLLLAIAWLKEKRRSSC